MGQPSAAARSVAVVGDPSTSAITDDIVIGLQKVGVPAVAAPPTGNEQAVVVVLCPELVASGVDIAGLAALHGPRLVPVVARPMDGTHVPDALAALNWIPWNPAERGTTIRMIASACTTDLASFHALQSLVARAEGWALGGASVGDAVSTPKELARLRREASTVRARDLSDVVRQFLAASEVATRKTVRKKRGRRLRWLVLTVLLAVALREVVGTVTYVRGRQKLDVLSGSPVALPQPRIQLVKLAGLAQIQLDRGESLAPELVNQMLGYLSVPGAVRSFGMSPDGMFVNAGVTGSEGGMLWADGGGSLWSVDGPSGQPQRVAANLVDHGYQLAATADQSTIVMANDSTVTVRRGEHQQSFAVPAVSGLVLSDDGKQLVVESDTRTQVWTLDGSTPTKVRSVDASSYLTSGMMHGQLVLVARDSKHLVISSAVSGKAVRTVTDVTNQLSAAAVGGNGELVVQGKDRRLWLSTGTDLTSSGIVVPDVLTVLHVLPDSSVAWAGRGAPTQVVDLQTGSIRGWICTEAGSQAVWFAPDGSWAVCDSGAQNELWRLGEALPEPAPASLPAAVTTVSAQGRRASLGSAGLELAGPNATHTYATASNPLTLEGRATAVTLAPSGLGVAVGSDAGQVVVADVLEGAELRGTVRWQSPDRSPVTALSLSDSSLRVTTTTGVWTVPACAGCTTDMSRLMATVRSRQMYCYQPELKTLLSSKVIAELGVSLCEEG